MEDENFSDAWLCVYLKERDFACDTESAIKAADRVIERMKEIHKNG